MFDSANVIFRRLEGNVPARAAGPNYVKLREVMPDAPLEPPTEPGVRCVLENRQIAVEDRFATLPNEHGEIGRALHELARRGLPIRSQAFTPLLREGKAIGVMIVSRGEVRPFQEHELELMKGFADQAVIAIENARLLNELRESLEQQTATADVLRVISSSPGELKPVFQAMLESATRICEARFGTLFRFDGDMYHLAAQFGTPSDLVAFQRQRGPFRPPPDLDEITRTKRTRHTADAAADPNPGKAATLGGARSAMYVPMVKHDHLVGALVIYRQEVRPFTDKQIELVENFAAQAVIAIENTRLLNELRQRTTDLTESLEQQTATSEVLRVISSSPGELEPVFQAMLANATRICEAKFGILMLRHGDGFRTVAINGAPSAYTEAMTQNPYIPPRPGSGLVVLAQTKQPVQMADLQSEPGYIGNRLTTLAGARTLLIVPLLKDDELVGAINIYRQEVRPFKADCAAAELRCSGRYRY